MKQIEVLSNGNSVLKLNTRSPLGKRGKLIEIPSDEIIYKSVCNLLSWEIEESQFLCAELIKLQHRKSVGNYVLVDIGAHVGLVSLQSLNLSKTSNDIILVEPLKRHVEAINRNLSDLMKSNSVKILPFALSHVDGKAEMYTETINHGNSSLIRAVVPENESIITTITLKNIADFTDEYLNDYEHIVIKCDTQGLDASILSRIPERIWQKVTAIIVEVWAIPEISHNDVNKLIAIWKKLRFKPWTTELKEKVELEYIEKFWLGKTNNWINLYLTKDE